MIDRSAAWVAESAGREARPRGVELEAVGADLGVVGEAEGQERRPEDVRELLGKSRPA